MGILDELKKLTHPYDDEDEEYEDFEEPRERSFDDRRNKAEDRRNKVVNIHATTQLKVVLVKPDRFENASEIADQLKDKRTVVLNLESTNKDVARRLIDFLSGVAYAVKHLSPNVKVYGVQAANAPGMYESRHEGKLVTLDTVSTFADGIAVKHPGDTTFALTQEYVDDIVTVSEDEIAAAILAMIEKQKLIAEGAGAVSVAAAMFGKLPIAGKKTVCIVSGGNIDVNILSRVITRGLITSGRNSNLQIALEDKPGQLVGVSEIVAKCGANVVRVSHEHSDPNMAISSCFLKLSMETRDFAQIEEIKRALTKAGFKIVS